MVLKRIISKIPHAAILILTILSFLAFVGIFTFIPEAEYHYQETLMIEETKAIGYFITVTFKSAGAFIAGKKIDVEVEISKAKGKNFVQGESNYMLIGEGGSVYNYPPDPREFGMYEGGLVDLTVNNNSEKLTGSNSLFFSRPGDYPIYSLLVMFNEDGQIATKSEKIIPISKSEAWLVVEQNTRIFSLSLLILALTLATLLNSRRK